MEAELVADVTPLRLSIDGKVIIPMTIFHSIKKGDYDDAWASTAVRYLPAFTPEARDPDSGHVDLNHVSSRNTPSNRKKILVIVRQDIFSAACNGYIRNAYDKYISDLYSNERVVPDEGDYPFELDGFAPVSMSDLLDVFFEDSGPGMKLMRLGEWDRLCAWYYIVTYWVTSETHDGEWVVKGLDSYYESRRWKITLDCSHFGRKNRSIHPLVRIAKKKACDNMKHSFRTKMGRLYGRTLELQASMTGSLGVDERFVNLSRFLPKVVKSNMTRIHGCRFKMKLWRENELRDLEVAITLSVQGTAKAAKEGGMKKVDLEELVGNVIGRVYDEDDVGGNKTGVPSLPPMPAAATQPPRAKKQVKKKSSSPMPAAATQPP